MDTVGSPVMIRAMRMFSNADQVHEYMLSAGTGRPSNHPDVNAEDTWVGGRWNGWNHTHAVGYDRDQNLISITVTHYASGWDEIAVGKAGHIQSAGMLAFKDVVFPVWLLEPVSEVLHPEHTP